MASCFSLNGSDDDASRRHRASRRAKEFTLRLGSEAESAWHSVLHRHLSLKHGEDVLD
jgi:hypothetical protein